jgi:hypothetical protein
MYNMYRRDPPACFVCHFLVLTLPAGFLADLVLRERLAAAATSGALQLNLSSLLGPLLAGFLLATHQSGLGVCLERGGFSGDDYRAAKLPSRPHG